MQALKLLKQVIMVILFQLIIMGLMYKIGHINGYTEGKVKGAEFIYKMIILK